MAQKKGQTGNPHGRPKGTPNKVTKNVREWIFDILQNNMKTLEADLAKLEPKERWQMINGLLPYIVSKRLETSNKHYTFDGTDGDKEQVIRIGYDFLPPIDPFAQIRKNHGIED